MLQLFDGTRAHDAQFIIDAPVLGHRSVTEGVVSWAEKKNTGETFTRETPWGLIVTAVAAAEPVVQLFLNQVKLRKFLTGWGPTTEILLQSFGIKLAGPVDRTQKEAKRSDDTTVAIVLPLGNGDYHVLAVVDASPKEATTHLGSILVAETGFFFFSPEENLPGNMPITQPTATPLPTTTSKKINHHLTKRHQHETTSMTLETSPNEAEEAAAAWEAQQKHRQVMSND